MAPRFDDRAASGLRRVRGRAGPLTIVSDGRTAVTLPEGQPATVAGTDLIIRVGPVKDFTSQGCQGGLVGCRDHALLEVARGAAVATDSCEVGSHHGGKAERRVP